MRGSRASRLRRLDSYLSFRPSNPRLEMYPDRALHRFAFFCVRASGRCSKASSLGTGGRGRLGAPLGGVALPGGFGSVDILSQVDRWEKFGRGGIGGGQSSSSRGIFGGRTGRGGGERSSSPATAAGGAGGAPPASPPGTGLRRTWFIRANSSGTSTSLSNCSLRS